jgi:AraC-like DNA-binding protein
MLFIAGIAIAVFIEFLLITKKGKSETDVILALWIFTIALHLFFAYLFYTGHIFDYPFLLATDMPLPLLHAVFLYWYVASMTEQLPANRKLIALHFLPALIMYVYLTQFFILPEEEKIRVYQTGGAGYETFDAIRFYAIILSGIIYIGWSIALLSKHKKRILDEFSYQDKIDLQWLRILTLGLGAIWLLIFVSDEILFGGVVVFVFLIGFFGIRQARIFTHHVAPETEKEKYSKSGLTKELSDKLYNALIDLMKKEAPYRKNDLSIDDLARKLEIHANYLSQVINEREKKNFYDFVNYYRLAEFKKLASDPKNRHFTLLALAFECGFNSKSSFNRYFKKATGQTPSEFFLTLPVA